MQAKEKVAFIEQFDPLAQREVLSDHEKDALFSSFITTCDDLLHKHPGTLQRYETFADGHFKKIIESPLTITASDGTYLHVLVWGQSTKLGYYDLGLAVIAHDQQDNWVDGYIYGVEEDMSVVRTPVPPLTQTDILEPVRPFSVIDHQKAVEELHESMISPVETERTNAEAFHATVTEKVYLNGLEHDLGWSRSPSLSELMALNELVSSAIPYPPKV